MVHTLLVGAPGCSCLHAPQALEGYQGSTGSQTVRVDGAWGLAAWVLS